MSEDWTDGNRLAGPLADIFAVDATTMVGRCASCGTVGPLAATHVYDRAPGIVARCPGCGAELLRLVRGPQQAWLDVRGVSYLEVSLPAV
jgi:hypothetical protein